jgi:peptidyl-prolyl cis-trans isomerase SurA
MVHTIRKRNEATNIYMELNTLKKKIKMRKNITLFSALIFALLISENIQPQTTIDRIIAKVDESIITLHDLNKKLEQDNNYQKIHSSSEKLEYQNTVLEMMIVDKLLLKKADEQGITINEKLLNMQLMEIYNAKSLDELKVIMKDLNVDFDEAKETIKNSLRVEKLISSEVYDKNQVTQQEVENYSDTMLDNIEVRSKQILIKIPDGSDETEIQKYREKAQMIRNKLLNGEDFNKISSQYSDAQNKDEGGDTGFIRKGGMPENFEKVLFSLQNGEISEIIQTNIGFHILQIIESRKIEANPDKLRAKITKERENELIKEYIDRLKKESIIKILL